LYAANIVFFRYSSPIFRSVP